MGFFDRFISGQDTGDFPWHEVHSADDVNELLLASGHRTQVVLKHSPRCGTSFFAKSSLESMGEDILKTADVHLINVIRSRPVSQYFAEKTGIRHESPQLFVIRNDAVIWHASHYSITEEKVMAAIHSVSNDQLRI